MYHKDSLVITGNLLSNNYMYMYLPSTSSEFLSTVSWFMVTTGNENNYLFILFLQRLVISHSLHKIMAFQLEWTGLRKTLKEEDKMLVTSIFSFCVNVF